MKKIIALLIISMLMVSLVACQNNQDEIYENIIGETKADTVESSKASSEVSSKTSAEESEIDTSPERDDASTLHIRSFAGSSEFGIAELIEEYEEEHPDVTIIYDYEIDYMNVEISASEYAREEESYRKRLITEMLSGDAPDIIEDNIFTTERHEESGMFTDLYELIDADDEISRDDFFESILKGLETNGALYEIVRTFAISAVSVSKPFAEIAKLDTNVEGIKGTEMIDAYLIVQDSDDIQTQAPPSFSVKGEAGRGLLFLNDKASYIDWANKTADFNSPEFISFLEKQKAIKTDLLYKDEGVSSSGTDFFDVVVKENYNANTPEERKTVRDVDTMGNPMYLLSSYLMGTLQDLNYESDYVSAPILMMRRDDKSLFDPISPMAIPSRAKNKELAWDFIKFCIKEVEDKAETETDKYAYAEKLNNHFMYGLPINKSNAEKYINEYYNVMIPLDEDELENLKKKIYSMIDKSEVSSRKFSDLYYGDIFEKYFDQNLISAEECAREIQDRTEIYLKE